MKFLPKSLRFRENSVCISTGCARTQARLRQTGNLPQGACPAEIQTQFSPKRSEIQKNFIPHFRLIFPHRIAVQTAKSGRLDGILLKRRTLKICIRKQFPRSRNRYATTHVNTQFANVNAFYVLPSLHERVPKNYRLHIKGRDSNARCNLPVTTETIAREFSRDERDACNHLRGFLLHRCPVSGGQEYDLEQGSTRLCGSRGCAWISRC